MNRFDAKLAIRLIYGYMAHVKDAFYAVAFLAYIVQPATSAIEE